MWQLHSLQLHYVHHFANAQEFTPCHFHSFQPPHLHRTARMAHSVMQRSHAQKATRQRIIPSLAILAFQPPHPEVNAKNNIVYFET